MQGCLRAAAFLGTERKGGSNGMAARLILAMSIWGDSLPDNETAKTPQPQELMPAQLAQPAPLAAARVAASRFPLG